MDERPGRYNDGQGRQPTRGAVCTIDEVARELGLSPQRVCQIEANALRKLREHRVLVELSEC